MIENYKDIIKVGAIIKNYKIMCKLLQENINTGHSRDAQLKEWNRHFKYKKEGQNYIILEVYKNPKERIDLRSSGNNGKHGLSNTKLYNVWRNMKERCTNPSSQLYGHYGGRGITVCDEWMDSVVPFYEWAIANGYEEDVGLSIDRIDVNGNYEPLNCRWVDDKAQIINRRISTGKIINAPQVTPIKKAVQTLSPIKPPNIKNTKFVQKEKKVRKPKKDYIIQNIDGVYLTYLIFKNRTYPTGTYFSEKDSLDSIDKLYNILVNL